LSDQSFGVKVSLKTFSYYPYCYAGEENWGADPGVELMGVENASYTHLDLGEPLPMQPSSDKFISLLQ